MMITRRNFLKTAGAGIAGLTSTVTALESRTQATEFFNVHPFIEANPDAVFIMKTSVPDKYDKVAKKDAGLDFGKSVFVPSESGGIPLTANIAVKGNLKTANPDKYDHDLIMSHTIDAYFTEGVFEGIKRLGIKGSQIHLREVTRPDIYSREPYGFATMCERAGVDLRLDLGPSVSQLTEGRDFNWVDVPDGVFYKRIPYLEPLNTPGTWLMDISKFKAHGMGLTLCCKDLQGSVAHNYQAFCTAWGGKMSVDSADLHADAYDVIKTNFERHLEGGVPRWDKPGTNFNSGIGMETWITRTLDNLSVNKAGLYVMEGIYGRDGQGNNDRGPNPVDQVHNFNSTGVSDTGKAWDWMSNVIVFGKDSFRVDIIGHWLGGHEPGNMGLFHCAIDRGMSTALNPRKVPVYLWDTDGTATRIDLETLEQTPLLTYYLTRNYNGQDESMYHLCNEPFDYGIVTGVDEPSFLNEPDAIVLHQNSPNPFNPYTTIEYSLPKTSNARLEIYNGSGQLVDVLVDSYRRAGTHMAVWNTGNHSSGLYFYRFRSGSYTRTKKMMLVR